MLLSDAQEYDLLRTNSRTDKPLRMNKGFERKWSTQRLYFLGWIEREKVKSGMTYLLGDEGRGKSQEFSLILKNW